RHHPNAPGKGISEADQRDRAQESRLRRTRPGVWGMGGDGRDDRRVRARARQGAEAQGHPPPPLQDRCRADHQRDDDLEAAREGFQKVTYLTKVRQWSTTLSDKCAASTARSPKPSARSTTTISATIDRWVNPVSCSRSGRMARRSSTS